MDLVNDLLAKQNELNISVKSLRKTSEEYANAYTKYRIALSQELLKLKDEGMSATLAYDVARGKDNIARLKYDEICKEGIYKANQEAINSIKLQIKVLEGQISREWANIKSD